MGVGRESVMGSEWQRWMDVVDTLFAGAADANAVTCPHCGATGVRQLLFAGPDRLGWGVTWCETCSHGVRLSRVNYPPNAITLPIDDQVEIPAFTEVTPHS